VSQTSDKWWTFGIVCGITAGTVLLGRREVLRRQQLRDFLDGDEEEAYTEVQRLLAAQGKVLEDDEPEKEWVHPDVWEAEVDPEYREGSRWGRWEIPASATERIVMTYDPKFLWYMAEALNMTRGEIFDYDKVKSYMESQGIDKRAAGDYAMALVGRQVWRRY